MVEQFGNINPLIFIAFIFPFFTIMLVGYLAYLLSKQSRDEADRYRESMQDVIKIMKAKDLTEKTQSDAMEKQYTMLMEQQEKASAAKNRAALVKGKPSGKITEDETLKKLVRERSIKDIKGQSWDLM